VFSEKKNNDLTQTDKLKTKNGQEWGLLSCNSNGGLQRSVLHTGNTISVTREDFFPFLYKKKKKNHVIISRFSVFFAWS